MAKQWSKLSDDDLHQELVQWFTDAKESSANWRKEAKRCFDYRAGHQWPDDVMEMMADTEVDVTFNRIDVFVSAVTGLETINRTEARYIPRVANNTAAGMASSILDAAARYVDDDSDSVTHQSEAFADMVTCGMGWTEDMIDWYSNPDGDIKCLRLDPLYVYWDPSATDKNLADAKVIGRIKMMRGRDISDEFDVPEDDWLSGSQFTDRWDDDNIDADVWNSRDPYLSDDNESRKRKLDKTHPVMQVQWCELEPAWKVEGMGIISEEEYNNLKELYESQAPQITAASGVEVPPLVASKVRRKRWRQAFAVGGTVLDSGDAPSQEGPTLQCMTGRRDRNKRMWYGLARCLMDPQDWTNKLFGKTLAILQYNSHGGGYLAEASAFVDPSEAEDTLADYSKITWLNDGALQAGRVTNKPAIPYPTGLDRLMQVANNMFVDVSGISLELLGLANRDQPGVLESQRKQSGMTILAWAFDAMRAYRRSRGRVLASLIQQYISDGRLIRIYNPQEGAEQFIPLMRDETAIEYDIVVNDSPRSTNEQERVLAIILQLAPILERFGAMPPIEVLDHLPLPTALVEKWKQKITGEQENQEQQMAMQLAMQKEASEVAKNQADAALKQAQAQKTMMDAVAGD
jgi:hypothetical protein